MNELDVFFLVLIEFTLILFLWKLGREYLYASIATNLILVSVAGPKLIEIFGYTTNVGNIFYASVFVATYFIIEHCSRKDGERAIGLGAIVVVLFVVMGQLVIAMSSVPETTGFSAALATIFRTSVRVASASVIAYIIAQSINVGIYATLREKGVARLWLRVATAGVASQFVDSILFFSIAFLGVLPLAVVVESMLVGFFLKVSITLLSIPLIYVSRRMRET